MRRAGSILCIAAVCAVVTGAGVVRAQPLPTTIATGVLIGTVDVSGMTAGEAKAAVKTAYYAPLVVRVGHHLFSVKPVHFHTSVPVDAAVQSALTAPADTAVPLAPTFDHSRVHKWVVNLAAQTYRRAIPGVILLRGDHPVLFHAKPGHALRTFSAAILIRNAINTGTRTTIVPPLRKLTAPDVKPAPIIVIHRGSNRLVLFIGDRYVRAFGVATGQPAYPTPLGQYDIVVKQVNPWWYPPPDAPWAQGAKPIPPGPGNPLGTRWMGLSASGVGIHGTNAPWSIGHSESHGCIRMQIPDAEWLYQHVRIGTPVFIIPS